MFFPVQDSDDVVMRSGGGIGGVTLALVLGKYAGHDIQVDLYEAKGGFSEIGAGISIWNRTWFILKSLGLGKSIGEVAVKPPVEVPRRYPNGIANSTSEKYAQNQLLHSRRATRSTQVKYSIT